MSFQANEIINGKYGYLFDENGQQLQTCQEFEFGDEFEKEAIQIPGKFHTSHKVMGGELSGSVRLLKSDSRLQRKISENPTMKFNFVGKLADPTAKGEEAVLLMGVSFDGNDIMKFAMGELSEVELDFTVDDYKYLDTID